MRSRLRGSTGQTFRALRHRNYRLLWFGQTGHSATLWMDQVARAVALSQDKYCSVAAMLRATVALSCRVLVNAIPAGGSGDF